MKVVAFLQNPWSPVHAGGTWERNAWLRALAISRTGQRLKLLESPDIDIYYENACPIVCANPTDIMPSDLNHMSKVIDEQKPDVIIVFGAPARKAMQQLRNKYKQPLMQLPHPAYRVVTNKLFSEALSLLKNGFEGTVTCIQARNGQINIECLNPIT